MNEPLTLAGSAATEAEYFDGLAATEGDFNPFTEGAWRLLRRRFVEFVAPSRPLQILDIGCGTGQSRQLYIDDATEYVGVDLSGRALELARRKFPESTWRCCDARQLPFADRAFDVIAYSSVLHHIPDFPVALREGLRVLRPGGHVFAFDPNVLHPAMALFRHPKSPLYTMQGVSPNEAPLLPRRLRSAFANAGLVQIRQRAQSDLAYRQVAPRVLNACLRLYNVADHWFERVGLGRWFGSFVITSGRKVSSSGERTSREVAPAAG
jgi:ubiquinone/menaquinone biosynthesis C-methylase UbiE